VGRTFGLFGCPLRSAFGVVHCLGLDGTGLGKLS
jgi:hypothetical protein